MEPLEDRRLLAITVDTLVDELDGSITDGDISLRDAIAAAPAGETIDFSVTGTINLTLGELKIEKSLTIGGPTSGTLTIDASGNDPTPDENYGDGTRVFNIDDGDIDSQIYVVIRGLTLTGGDSSQPGGAVNSLEDLEIANSILSGNAAVDGGGVSCWETAILVNTTISGNTAFAGGGILSRTGNLTVIGSLISANQSYVDYGAIASVGGSLSVINSSVTENTGGGVTVFDGSAILSDCTISGNDAENGGGINVERGSLAINGCTISGNVAERFGGGIGVSEGELTILDSTISGNRALESGGGVSIVGTAALIDTSLVNNYGGGIYIEGTLSISNCDVSKNLAPWLGGGIYGTGIVDIRASVISQNSTPNHGGGMAIEGILTVVDSTVADNVADGNGGGIQVSGNLTVRNSTISHNRAKDGDGGGILSLEFNSVLTVTDSAISNNSAGLDVPPRPLHFGSGGGIMCHGALIVDGSSISNNSSINGGGILLYGNTTQSAIRYSSINNNSARDHGGGMLNSPQLRVPPLNILNCTISNNSAGESGGGIYVSGLVGDRPLVISHCTVVCNYAFWSGGGIGGSSSIGDVFLDHVILAGNKRFEDVADDTDGYLTANWSLIGHPKYETLGEHNLIGVNPLLRSLADNGGLTFTHALLEGSPAVNAGDPAFAAPPYFDQRGPGYSRKVDGRIDIGAYEGSVEPIQGDFDSDGDVDGRDFLAWQRNPSVGSLSDWQEQYGAGELSASQELSVESEEPESSMAPWAVSSLSTTRDGVPFYEREAEVDDSYVEQVDRAVEQWIASNTLMGKPAVVSFGEMVARRGVKRISDCGIRIAE